MKKFASAAKCLSIVCEILLAVVVFSPSLSFAASKSPRIVVSGSQSEGSLLTLSVAGGGVYAWDLKGTGNYTTKGSTVSRVFSNSGSYVVRVKRVGADRGTRSRASISSKGIRVKNKKPTASAGGPYEGQAGSAVTFRASASDPSPADRAAGFKFKWNFGDGTTGSGKSPSHTYQKAGTYTVTVTASDKDGAKSRPSTAQVSVSTKNGNPPPPPSNTPSGNPTPTPAPISGPITSAQPQELVNDIITNPSIGWQSCDKVNTSGQDAQGFKNKVAFVKYYWKNIETADNVYNWSQMDNHLNQARNSGQTWAFRIIVDEPTITAPEWLRNMGVPGTFYTAEGGPQVWTPDWNNATARQKHFEFLQAVGQRYNGKPGVDSIDIGSIGMWGEWHWGDTSPAIPMPSQTNLNLVIDKYFEYFPDIPKIAQLEHQASLTYAISRGAGFRGDCWGNMQWQNRISPPGMYAQRIAGADAENAWRQAPLAMETCWTMSYWQNQGWNTDYILQWAVDNHISQVHNKNSSVPSAMIPKVNEMLKKLGYRYVLKDIAHVRSVQAGASMVLSMAWANKGNAPSYGNQVVGVQLRNSQGVVVATIATPTEVKEWMPGNIAVDQTITIPAELPAGQYTLAISIVDPVSKQPKIQLANAGKDGSGWYPLTSLEIE